MLASIIIAAYNGEKYLPGCLRSIFTNLPTEVEVILIDNASSDVGGRDIEQDFPQVVFIHNHENVGFAAACNQGAALASGEFLVFLNQDTRACAGWLEGLLEPFSRDPLIGLTTSRLLLMSQPERINLCGQDIHFSGLAFARGLLRPAGAGPMGGPVGAVSGAAFAIRRALWERLGGFDEGFFMYYEETDLCWRARRFGYYSVYAPGSVVYHDYRLESSANALYYAARNRWLLLLKHWRVPTLLLLAPGLLLAELVDWGAMLLSGGGAVKAKARAYGWLVKHIKDSSQHGRVGRAAGMKPDWFLLEQCTGTLKPVLLTGGLPGKMAIGAANLLLGLNYYVALGLAKILNC